MCASVGVSFDPWQQDLNKCLLAKRKDGLFAADTVAISIARQVGKTFDVGAVVFGECIAEPGTTVVWTAHRFKVARETFNELRALARSPKLAPYIDYDAITTAAGNECIPFKNGSRILFAARERGAIRGFTKVRILILDEAQILTHSQMADVGPTMNQAHNPLIILMGTPPKPSDPSEVFTELRHDALTGESEDVLYVEISADPGADPDDLEQLRKANPGYPARTPLRAIKRLRRLLSVDDFLREVFGIWDEDADSGLIPRLRWADLIDADPEAAPERMPSFAVEVDIDRAWSSIGAAGTRSDGLMHVELVDRQRGTGWVVDRCVVLDQQHGPASFVVDGGGPAASLIPELKRVGMYVITAGVADVAQATAGLIDAVNEQKLRHGPQPELDAAVAAARKRPLGDGSFAIGRKKSTDDVTPLVAVLLAAWGLEMADAGPNIW